MRASKSTSRGSACMDGVSRAGRARVHGNGKARTFFLVQLHGRNTWRDGAWFHRAGYVHGAPEKKCGCCPPPGGMATDVARRALHVSFFGCQRHGSGYLVIFLSFFLLKLELKQLIENKRVIRPINEKPDENRRNPLTWHTHKIHRHHFFPRKRLRLRHKRPLIKLTPQRPFRRHMKIHNCWKIVFNYQM